MRFRATLLIACALLPLAAIGATAQCRPGGEKQIAEVRDSWVKNWNDGQLGNVVNLYYSHALLLTADGSRASGKDEIRAAFQKQIGSKVDVHSLGPAWSGALAYENGTYTQTANGQSVEGNYLVVLLFGTDGKWLIVQHASTAKR